MKSWIFIAIIVCAALFSITKYTEKGALHFSPQKTTSTEVVVNEDLVSNVSPVTIGGDFTLTDQKGRIVKESDLEALTCSCFLVFLIALKYALTRSKM